MSRIELENWRTHDVVAEVMEIEDWGFVDGCLYFQGPLKYPSSESYRRVSRFAQSKGLIVRLVAEPTTPRFILVPVRRRLIPSHRKIQLLLLVLTIFSTLLAGAFLVGVGPEEIMDNPWLLLRGFQFAFPLLVILGAHELAHYLAARHWGIRASLPYFIPFPNILGTMGALIAIRDPFPSRRALFDVGLAGPAVSFILSVIVILLGLGQVQIIPFESLQLGAGEGLMYFGDSLITSFLFSLKAGNLPEGYDLVLGPLPFAGWVGLFVTAINLLPLGQLDGGHIAYAVFGKLHPKVTAVAGLIIFAVGLFLRSPVWLFMLLMVFFLGFRHAPPLDDITTLNFPRRILAFLALIIFILSFIPVPIRYLGG